MKRWLSVSLAVWLILSIFCGPLAISADTEDSGGFTARRMPPVSYTHLTLPTIA